MCQRLLPKACTVIEKRDQSLKSEEKHHTSPQAALQQLVEKTPLGDTVAGTVETRVANSRLLLTAVGFALAQFERFLLRMTTTEEDVLVFFLACSIG